MSRRERVWIVDDDRSIRWVLEKALRQADMDVQCFETGARALAALGRGEPEAMVTDIRMPEMDGLSLLQRVQESHPGLPVIIMTAHSDLDSAVSAFQGGAFEYLAKPFDVDVAVDLVRRAVHHYRRQHERPGDSGDGHVPEIIGEAPAMQEVFRAIGRLTRSQITVLINGESGTGKELVARALHRHSPRAEQPFIALNMAAIPRDLLESELFGHERGAFTGAHTQRRGRFEQADGGTLFLDEIGDMPAELQTRLLRVLSDGEFYRVGGLAPLRVDVRIIAATHQNLEDLVAQGRFREDLFHRLNVIRIHIPALRERAEDIPKLARYFLSRAASELKAETKLLRPETEQYLTRLPWPGNVRQIENTCRWLTVMASGREVHLSDLPPELRSRDGLANDEQWSTALGRWAEQRLAAGYSDILGEATPLFERVLITATLARTGGRRQEAARLLGWGRNTLTRKIKELGMGDDEEDETEIAGDSAVDSGSGRQEISG